MGTHKARNQRSAASNRRRGRPSQTEQRAVELMLQGDVTLPTETIAIAMRRDPKTVTSWITAARERLQERAQRYVDVHALAMEGALKDGDYAIAGKLAWEAATALTDAKDTGRIIEPPAREQQTKSGITVQIGVQLGGVSHPAETPMLPAGEAVTAIVMPPEDTPPRITSCEHRTIP